MKEYVIKNPNGSVQGLCSSAAALMAITFGFIGYMSYGSNTADVPWQGIDLFWLVSTSFGVLLLAAVPIAATYPRKDLEEHKSIRLASVFYIFGAFFILLGIMLSLAMDFNRSRGNRLKQQILPTNSNRYERPE